MTSCFSRIGGMARRDFLRAGFGSIAFGAAGALGRAPSWAQTAAAQATPRDRILVVVELSGGNDGLNTVVPYGDDAYYRARPRIGIKPARLRKLDEHFGLQYTMAGSSGSTRTATWRSSMVSATSSLPFRIFPRWRTGRRRRRTAASFTAGSAGWRTPWTRRGTPTTSSTSTPSSRSRCARAATSRWCSTIRRNSCAPASPTRPRRLQTIARARARCQRGPGLHVRRVEQRAQRRATGARCLGALPHPGRLWLGTVRPRPRRGADRGGFPDQASTTSPTATTPSTPTSTRATCTRACGPTRPTTLRRS